jgi:hypothetical protein
MDGRGEAKRHARLVAARLRGRTAAARGTAAAAWLRGGETARRRGCAGAGRRGGTAAAVEEARRRWRNRLGFEFGRRRRKW